MKAGVPCVRLSASLGPDIPGSSPGPVKLLIDLTEKSVPVAVSRRAALLNFSNPAQGPADASGPRSPSGALAVEGGRPSVEELEKLCALPKSMTISFPDEESSRFAGFKSPCDIRWPWSAATAYSRNLPADQSTVMCMMHNATRGMLLLTRATHVPFRWSLHW